MKINCIKFVFISVIIFQTIIISKVTSQKNVIVDDYFQLDAMKFNRYTKWIVDSINSNDNYYFKSVFWYKPIANCIFFVFGSQTSYPNKVATIKLYTNLFYKVFEYDLRIHAGEILEKSVIEPIQTKKFKECPNEKYLNFVYTDYVNVVVLMGGNERFGFHIMILTNAVTNMTYKERTDLVKSKIGQIEALENVVQVKSMNCSLTKPTIETFEEAQFRKCKQLNDLKTMEWFNKRVVLCLIISGLLWIIIYGIHWICVRRSRMVIVPF